MHSKNVRRGAAGQQYAIIVGLIAVLGILAVTALGINVRNLFTATSNTLTRVTNGTAGAGGTGGGTGGGNGPDPFSFTDLTEQPLSTQLSSNIVQITGLSGSATASLSGSAGTPQFRICADAACASVVQAYGSSSQTIANNQYVQLRMTSPASDGGNNAATFSINAVSDSWSVATGTSLYAFTSHTFTSCSHAGHVGPSITSCRSVYTTAWDETAAYFSVPVTGYQMWTVPTSANYRIRVAGAGQASGTYVGGRSGTVIEAEVPLTRGEFLLIAVGQPGLHTFDGSGGTFVARGSDYTSAPALIVGGGACGDYEYNNAAGNANLNATFGTDYASVDSSTPTSYSGPTGSAGSGAGSWHGGGGGGFLSSGTCNGCGGTQGAGFRQGLTGGYNNSTVAGGFGGGGAYHGGQNGAGGGGGYSGGRGGNLSLTQCFGGGSYVAPTMSGRSNVGGNTASGYVTITRL